MSSAFDSRQQAMFEGRSGSAALELASMTGGHQHRVQAENNCSNSHPNGNQMAASDASDDPGSGRWEFVDILDSLARRGQQNEGGSGAAGDGSDTVDPANGTDTSRLFKIAVNASWAVNWFLLGAKVYAVAVSSSKAVTAALVDSVVDLLSQGVLSMAERYISRHSPNYPVGRSRLEALSVIACAFIMSMASIEVIQYAALDLYYGLAEGRLPQLFTSLNLFLVMGVAVASKFCLWIFCSRVNAYARLRGGTAPSDTLAALAEDHLNDVASNAAALVTVSVAVAWHAQAWWVDAAGAILISLVIIGRWLLLIGEQVKKIVGHTAPPEYIQKVEDLALDHDPRLFVDCTRVYHFGARYNVEMEVVLPGDMTVQESHDIALDLQHKIERMEDVERAFVHVDHERRDGLEHKVERELALAFSSSNSPSTSTRNSNTTNSGRAASSSVNPLHSHSTAELRQRTHPANPANPANPHHQTSSSGGGGVSSGTSSGSNITDTGGAFSGSKSINGAHVTGAGPRKT